MRGGQGRWSYSAGQAWSHDSDQTQWRQLAEPGWKRHRGEQQSHHDRQSWQDNTSTWSSNTSWADHRYKSHWDEDLSDRLSPVDWNRISRVPFKRCFWTDHPEEQALKRRNLGIIIEECPQGGSPNPVRSFEQLGLLPDYALDALHEQGIQVPMPIQAQALPCALAGYNMVGIAETGSGKTLAFILPAIVHSEAQDRVKRGEATPIVLIMAPTRELAVQISEETSKLLAKSWKGCHGPDGMTAVCLYGGGSKREQKMSMSKGVHVAVATPGRLIDFVQSNVMSLSRVTYFVLDEADRMLDMGFHDDVAQISGQIRPDRQVLFFSATWSQEVQELARGLCDSGSDLVRIAVRGIGRATEQSERSATSALDVEANGVCSSTKLKARESITQDVVVVDCLTDDDPPKIDWDEQERRKLQHLNKHVRSVLGASSDHKILVFVGQKDLADSLSKSLQAEGFDADTMHGGLEQEVRLSVLEQFKTGFLRLLVVTDVLQRGIDIPQVSHVVIHGMGSIDGYVHRIGRTARGQGKTGHALLFFEYNPLHSLRPAELIEVLEDSQQQVPEELRKMADEVAAGKREVREASQKKKWKSSGCSWHGAGTGWRW